MGKLILHTCDVCQTSDAVSKWEVDHISGRLIADLCETHAAPLLDLYRDLDSLVVKPGQTRRSKPTFILNPDAED